MKTIADLITSFQSVTYHWAHQNSLPIHVISFLILGALSLFLFAGNNEKRKIYSDGIFIVLWLLFTLVTLGNIYQWGSQTYIHSAFQAGILCIMAFSYYLPLRIMNNSSSAFVAFFAFLFVLSGGVFIIDFVLADLIPVNVLLNWA